MKKYKGYLALAIVVLAIGLAWLISAFTPSPQKKAAAPSSPLVLVMPVEMAQQNLIIKSLGTVKAIQTVDLKARVSGTVVTLNEAFQPGNFVQKGTVLANLDPIDYRLDVQKKESELEKAKADLALEMGQQIVAQTEIEQLKESLPQLGKALEGKSAHLAKREPQLAMAKAQVKSAQADLDTAKIMLERTAVKAPFNALITTRNISLGSEITTTENLSTLVNTDAYWVETAVPIDRLHFLQNYEGKGPIPAEIVLSSGFIRQGFVSQIGGVLESSSRMGQVFVTVENPLLLHAEKSQKSENTQTTDLAPMLLGDHVQVNIDLGTKKDLVALPRLALRDNDTVWLVKDMKLSIQPVDILWRDTDTVYVQGGLKEGDLVVTSALATPIHGMSVRIPKEAGKKEEQRTQKTAS